MAQVIEVTVYEIPKDPDTGRIRCQKCEATKKYLTGKSVGFVTKDATEAENNAFLKGLGYLEAPVIVVTVDGEIVKHWSGFNPGECDDLAYKLK